MPVIPLVGRARVRAALKRNLLLTLLGIVLLFWLFWPRSSSSVIQPSPTASIKRRVVAVADLHGDLDHARHVLRMTGVIDARGEWVAGDDWLVSTGDIVDRGDDTQALYRLFDNLRAQAPHEGGWVLNCLGNHEVMNALGDWRYVTKGDIQTFGGVKPRRTSMSTQGWIGQTWMANYSITHTVSLLPEEQIARVRVNDKGQYNAPRVSFVHGGITPAYATKGPDYINTIGSQLMDRALSLPWPKLTGHLPPSSPDAERELYGPNGPLWYRGYAHDSDSVACSTATQALDALSTHPSYDARSGMEGHGKVEHLVMGHTPHFDGHVIRCPQAEILLIDTGISRAYGGEQSALVFETELIPPTVEATVSRSHAGNLVRRLNQASMALWAPEAFLGGMAKHDPRSPQPWIQKQKITSFYYGRIPKTIVDKTGAVYF